MKTVENTLPRGSWEQGAQEVWEADPETLKRNQEKQLPPAPNPMEQDKNRTPASMGGDIVRDMEKGFEEIINASYTDEEKAEMAADRVDMNAQMWLKIKKDKRLDIYRTGDEVQRQKILDELKQESPVWDDAMELYRKRLDKDELQRQMQRPNPQRKNNKPSKMDTIA